MPDNFLKVIEEISKKISLPENIKSVPCKVIELLNDEKVRVEVVSTGATYTVLNRCGNDVHIGENVSLYYHGDVIIGSQAYIGAALNKASDKYYTKPETDDMLNGMSIQKISKSDFDALLVKNPNRVYFVYDNQGEYDIYIGNSKIDGEGGGSDYLPIYIKAKIKEYVESDIGTTTYEAGYPANLCEVVSSHRDSVTFKPQSKSCLLLASFNIKASDLSEFINTMETQGWNFLINVPMYTNSDDSTTITWCLTMFTRQSNGGTVQILNLSSGFSQHSHLMVLYGATSVDVVQAGNLPYDVTYSYTDLSDGNNYTLVGFKTIPQTNKYRVYANERNVWGGDQVNFCTEKSEIPTEGEPSNYTPTVLDTDAGSTMLTGNGTLSFDTNLNSSGIVWWGARGENPSLDWEPLIKSKTYATVVLDVNYD